MIISQIKGGLGNQLFQYAFGRALAARLGTTLKLDISHYDGPQRVESLAGFKRKFKLDQFRVGIDLATEAEIRSLRDWRRSNRLLEVFTRLAREISPRYCYGYFRERTINYDPGWSHLLDNVYVDGFWQSEKYFDDIADTIRSEFVLKNDAARQAARQTVDEARVGNGQVVAVHARRGDLAYAAEVLNQPLLTGLEVQGADYFAAAMARFDPDSTFLVFSESEKDLDWCRANLHARNLIFCRGQSDVQDFATMCQCDHFIMSNSTFSWWAAWMGANLEKKVVLPKRWYHDAPRYRGHRLADLIPSQWTTI